MKPRTHSHLIHIPLFLLFIGVLLVPAGQAYGAIIYSQTDTSGSPISIGSESFPTVLGIGDDTLLPDGMPFSGSETIHVQLRIRATDTPPADLTDAWQFTLYCSGSAFGGGWFQFTRTNDSDWSDYPALAGGTYQTINLSFPVDDNFLWDGNAGFCNGAGPNGMDMQIGFGSTVPIESAGDSGGNGYVVIATDFADLPTGNTLTRIDRVSPPGDLDGSNALATSTTFAFEAEGYVNEDDWTEDVYVEQKWLPQDYDQLASAYCAVGGCYTTYTYPVDGPGAFEFATTTDIQRPGWYNLNTRLYANHKVFGITIPYWVDTFVATSTEFLVVAPSDIDVIKHTLASSTLAVITGATSPTAFCQFTDIVDIFDFDSESNLFTCVIGVVSGLTVPSEAQRTAIYQNFQDTIGTRVPFGYITRFITLASGGMATTSLPTLEIGFPEEYGHGLGGISANLTPWDDLMGEDSLIGNATSSSSTGGKTLREIVEPGLYIIVFGFLAIAIITDALKIRRKDV